MSTTPARLRSLFSAVATAAALFAGAVAAAPARAAVESTSPSVIDAVPASSPDGGGVVPTADPSPVVEPQTVPFNFDVQGAAEVRTGIRGRVEIAGAFAGTYDRQTGTFVGRFTLVPTVAHVVVLGLVPVTAETDWIFTEPVTGDWRDGVLRMRAAARIRHPHLSAFGVVVAGGGKCATTRASLLELRSSAATPIVDPFAGGTLTTQGAGFTISSLAGCGWLDGLLSAVAAGGGNQATLTLTRPQAG